MATLRMQTLERLAKVPELDWAPAPGLSSAGDLMYHLAAIELDWLGAEVRGDVFPPGWEEWFPVDVRDPRGCLSGLRGEPLNRHLARFAERLATFQVMPLEDFGRARERPACTVTPGWVLEAHHAGQIAYLGHLYRAANP